jgi:hypothetical protein
VHEFENDGKPGKALGGPFSGEKALKMCCDYEA